MKHRALLVSIVVSACGPAIKVPQSASGTVPFRVINDTDYQYCEFLMAEPHDPPNGLGPSWIGKDRALSEHSSWDLKVHPGVYQIYAGACDHAAESFIKRVRIDGPTEISLGGKPGGAPGVNHVALEVEILKRYTPVGPGGGGGGGESEPAGESGGESNEPAAAAPAGESCKGPGEETTNINDCCSKRDRIVSSQGFSHSVCCDANGPCESTR